MHLNGTAGVRAALLGVVACRFPSGPRSPRSVPDPLTRSSAVRRRLRARFLSSAHDRLKESFEDRDPASLVAWRPVVTGSERPAPVVNICLKHVPRAQKRDQRSVRAGVRPRDTFFGASEAHFAGFEQSGRAAGRRNRRLGASDRSAILQHWRGDCFAQNVVLNLDFRIRSLFGALRPSDDFFSPAEVKSVWASLLVSVVGTPSSGSPNSRYRVRNRPGSPRGPRRSEEHHPGSVLSPDTSPVRATVPTSARSGRNRAPSTAEPPSPRARTATAR